MNKSLQNIVILFSLLLLSTSCGNNDDNNSRSLDNAFTINGTNYETPNAYLVFDDNSPYGDAFFLDFLDSDLREDAVNGISVSSNMNHGVVLFVEHSQNDVLTEQDIIIANNTTYPLEKGNTLALTNVTGFIDTYTYNGITYGEPDLNASNVYEIENSGSGTLTINKIVIDYVARVGTVDCSYQITDDNGIVITGNYNGSFNILNGF